MACTPTTEPLPYLQESRTYSPSRSSRMSPPSKGIPSGDMPSSITGSKPRPFIACSISRVKSRQRRSASCDSSRSRTAGAAATGLPCWCSHMLAAPPAMTKTNRASSSGVMQGRCRGRKAGDDYNANARVRT